jgi:hypothetical protein
MTIGFRSPRDNNERLLLCVMGEVIESVHLVCFVATSSVGL